MKKPKILLEEKDVNLLKKKIDDSLNESPLEKNDLTALVIAALITIMPVIIGVLLLFFLVGLLFVQGY